MDKDKKLGANKTIYIFKLISHENTSEQATASNYRIGQLKLPKKKEKLSEGTLIYKYSSDSNWQNVNNARVFN